MTRNFANQKLLLHELSESDPIVFIKLFTHVCIFWNYLNSGKDIYKSDKYCNIK